MAVAYRAERFYVRTGSRPQEHTVITLGFVILVAAVAIGVVGVLSNSGSAHEFTGGFSVFGVDVTGSTGTLFSAASSSGRRLCSG